MYNNIKMFCVHHKLRLYVTNLSRGVGAKAMGLKSRTKMTESDCLFP